MFGYTVNLSAHKDNVFWSIAVQDDWRRLWSMFGWEASNATWGNIIKYFKNVENK